MIAPTDLEAASSQGDHPRRPLPEAEGRPITHVPALDGLRGVAVLAVLVYHHHTPTLPAGFLGVDVFFVLSGFLITTILLLAPTDRAGRFLGHFWGRRVRRLLPALALTLGLVALWAATLAAPEHAARVRDDGLASLLQLANWHFISEDLHYFTEFVSSPFRHFWSLSVEMQWYLAWPVVLLAVLRATGARRAPVVVMALGTVLAVGSTLLMGWLYEPGRDPSRVYYGTDTHAAPLLIGAVLGALVVHQGGVGGRWDRLLLPIAGLAGAAAVALAMLEGSGTDDWLYRGGFLAVALATAAIILSVLHPTPSWRAQPLARLLALRPLRSIGIISYGVYLLHWPIYFVVTTDRTGLHDWDLFAARTAVTLAAATASYLLLEQPVRRGLRLRPWARRTAAVATVGATAAVLVVATASAQGSLAGREDLDVDARPPPAGRPDVDAHEVPRVLVVGDSVAYTLALGFEDGRDRGHDLSVWNQGILYCELFAAPRLEGGDHLHPASDECAAWPDLWAERVRRFDPHLAVLFIGPWEVFDRRFEGETVRFGTPGHDERLLAELHTAVDVLGAGGAHVALLAVPPMTRDDGVSAPEWTAVEAWRVAHLNDLLRRVAGERPGEASVVDLPAIVCPDGDCPTELDGVRVRGDGIHYTAEGARYVVDALAPELRALLDEHTAAAP